MAGKPRTGRRGTRTTVGFLDRQMKLREWFQRHAVGSRTLDEVHKGVGWATTVGWRTLERDVGRLVKQGEVVRVRDGTTFKYSLARKVRSVPRFGDDELLLLSLLGRVHAVVGPSSRTFAKASDALTTLSQSASAAVLESFEERLEKDVYVKGGQAPDSMTGADLNTLLTAFALRRKVQITYKKGYGERDKSYVICPVKLVFWNGHPYFVSMPYMDWHTTSVYVKLSRIERATMLEETFDVDEEYLRKIDEWITNSFGIWDDPDDKVEEIELLFPTKMANSLREWNYHPSQLVRVSTDGVKVTMKAPVGQDLVDWILRWGGQATVVKPVALKDKLREAVATLAAAYGGNDT